MWPFYYSHIGNFFIHSYFLNLYLDLGKLITVSKILLKYIFIWYPLTKKMRTFILLLLKKFPGYNNKMMSQKSGSTPDSACTGEM